jgi:hypothetical protein
MCKLFTVRNSEYIPKLENDIRNTSNFKKSSKLGINFLLSITHPVLLLPYYFGEISENSWYISKVNPIGLASLNVGYEVEG